MSAWAQHQTDEMLNLVVFNVASRLITFFPQHISQMMSYLDLHVPSTYQSKKQGSTSINLFNDVRSDVYLIITNT